MTEGNNSLFLAPCERVSPEGQSGPEEGPVPPFWIHFCTKTVHFYTLFPDVQYPADSGQTGHFMQRCKTLMYAFGRQKSRGLGVLEGHARRTRALFFRAVLFLLRVLLGSECFRVDDGSGDHSRTVTALWNRMPRGGFPTISWWQTRAGPLVRTAYVSVVLLRCRAGYNKRESKIPAAGFPKKMVAAGCAGTSGCTASDPYCNILRYKIRK